MATSKECNTLTPISKQLKNIANQDLYEIEQQSKGTIKALAASVGSGSSDGLDAICTQLKSFTKAQLLEINRGSDEGWWSRPLDYERDTDLETLAILIGQMLRYNKIIKDD